MLTVSDVFSSVRSYSREISFVAASLATLGVAITYLIDPTLYEINIAVSLLLWVFTGLLNVLQQTSDQLFQPSSGTQPVARATATRPPLSPASYETDDSDRDDFAASMVVADVTGSTAAGYLAGGSLAGALVGEALSEEREEAQRMERDDSAALCSDSQDQNDSSDHDCDASHDNDGGFDSSDSGGWSSSDD